MSAIEAFLSVWPNAEYGPGSVVLHSCITDQNSIDYCIYLTEHVLGIAKGKPSFLDLPLLKSYKADKRPVGELRATLTFLNKLKVVQCGPI